MLHIVANESKYCWQIAVVDVKEKGGRDRGQRFLTHCCHY